MEGNPEIIGFGSACVDFIVVVATLPGSDESLPIEDYSAQGGGKVATAMAAASRLGGPVGFIGKVGDDEFGSFIKADLERHGVDTRFVKTICGASSPFSIVMTEVGRKARSILSFKGTISPPRLEDFELDRLFQYISGAKWLHLSKAGSAEAELAREFRRRGGKVCFDADTFSPEVDAFIPLIDAFIASRQFIRAYGGLEADTGGAGALREVLRRIQSKGPEIAIATLGEDGITGIIYDEPYEAPAFSVNVKDTTGAGDVFHGAFIFAMWKGYDPKEACVFAQAVSALKCTAIGGRAGLPTYDEVLRFMKTGKVELAEVDERTRFYRALFGKIT